MNNKKPEEVKIEVVESSTASKDSADVKKNEEKIEVSDKQDTPENIQIQNDNEKTDDVLSKTVEQLNKISEDQITLNKILKDQTELNKKLLSKLEEQEERFQKVESHLPKYIEDNKTTVDGYFDFDQKARVYINDECQRSKLKASEDFNLLSISGF